MHRTLLLLWVSLFLPASLYAQTAPGESTTAIAVATYCGAVEDFSESNSARLFAQVTSGFDLGTEWIEFASESQWKHYGKPKPIARVWSIDNQVVQVAIVFKNSREYKTPFAEYCYGPNGELARLYARPDVQEFCDDRFFRCRRTFGTEWIYLSTGQKIALRSQIDYRLLKSESTSYSTSKPNPPEYLNVRDLPFCSLVRCGG